MNSYNTVHWYRNIFSQVPSTKVRQAMVQCVYVVTSTGRDIYSAMTRVSVSSLRLSNPNLRITLVLDKPSSEALKAQADPLLDEVDQALAFDTPEGHAIYRHRFIKTSLRARIDGPYLFLDSDMLIRGDLSDVLSVDTDVACAPNHSKDRVEEQIWDEDRTALARMGWQTRPDVYVNSGLMLFNGTPGARRLAAAWHDGWLASSARTGWYRDQPALNAAIHETGPQLAVLPHTYNAQLKMDVRVARAAKVWHFYFSKGDHEPPFTVFDALVAGLMRNESMSRSGVEAAIRQSHPWRRTSWLDDVAAADVFRRGAFSDFDRVWFGGDRRRSLYLRARRTLGAWKAAAFGRSSSSIQSPSP